MRGYRPNGMERAILQKQADQRERMSMFDVVDRLKERATPEDVERLKSYLEYKDKSKFLRQYGVKKEDLNSWLSMTTMSELLSR